MGDLPRVVGLAGWAQSGKDTVANVLIMSHGYRRVAFADPIKDLARTLGWSGEKDRAGRRLLQGLGEGCRHTIDRDVWLRVAARKTYRILERGGNVVLTDVRYRNEAEWLRSHGWPVVRVVRPGVRPANRHTSELELDGWEFDAVIANDGPVGQLPDAVARMLAHVNREGVNR